MNDYNEVDLFSLYVNEIPNHLLSPEEERELFILYKEQNDQDAYERIVSCNLGLVISIAKKYVFFGIDILDLIGAGNSGLLIAIHRFDHKRGTKLSTYASWWIRQTIRQYVKKNRSLIKTPDPQQEAAIKISNYINSSNDERTIDEYDNEELEEKINVPAKTIDKVKNNSINVVSISDIDIIEDYDDEIEKKERELYLQKVKEDIIKAFDEVGLTQNEKYVIQYRFSEHPVSHEFLAERLNMTQQGVSHLEKIALKKLRNSNILLEIMKERNHE